MSEKLDKLERELLIKKELLKQSHKLEVIEPYGKNIIEEKIIASDICVGGTVYYGTNDKTVHYGINGELDIKTGWHYKKYSMVYFLGKTTQEALESIPTVFDESHNDCIISGPPAYA